MLDFEGEAHEIWVMAQLMPDEGIVDGISRIKNKLKELAQQATNTSRVPCQHIFKVYSYNVKCAKCGVEYITDVE